MPLKDYVPGLLVAGAMAGASLIAIYANNRASEPTCSITPAVVAAEGRDRTMLGLSEGYGCLDITRALNPGRDPGTLQPGEEILVARPDPDGKPRSELRRDVGRTLYAITGDESYLPFGERLRRHLIGSPR